MPKIRLAVALLIGLATAACGAGVGDGITEGGDPPPVVGVGGPAAQLMATRLASFEEAVRLRGQGADPEGGPLLYEWDYQGDGVVDAVGPETTVTPAIGERLPVQLTVTDEDGNASIATGIIEGTAAVGAARQEPLLVVRASCLLGETDTEFFFNAPARLTEPYATPDARSWQWDFENDGVFDLTTTVPFATHTYRRVGAQQCRVVATDFDGRTGEALVTVTVCRDGTLPEAAPGCMILSRLGIPLTENRSSLFLGITHVLTAFGGDPDGGPVSISWDLDGDGRFNDGVGRFANMLVTERGVHEVRMRMVDDEGRQSEALSTFIGREQSDGRVSPTAHASVECDGVVTTPGVPVNFMARAERIAPGYAGIFESVSWDFDGDGREDSTAHRTSFTFTTPGTYKPEVTVVRADGSDARSYVTVVVGKCGLPHDPAFWCTCDDRTILHTGTSRPVIECGPLDEPHPVPMQAGIVSVSGRSGPFPDGDPRAVGLDVLDHDRVVLTDPPQPPRIPAGYPLVLYATPTAVDGPTRVVPYDITVRLEDPGVRVQILKCLVRVIHLGFDTTFETRGGAPNHTGEFVIIPPPDPGEEVPGVAAVEIVFGEQSPPWLQVNEVLDLAQNWNATIEPTRLLIALSQPSSGGALVAGSNPLRFTVDFETTDAANVPTAGRIRLYDAAGELVGIEELKVSHVP